MNIIIESSSLAAPAISQSIAIGKANAKVGICFLVRVFFEQTAKDGK